ncbi:Fur family transcriptional regulator [Candidatus Omnitrophota bacterium]
MINQEKVFRDYLKNEGLRFTPERRVILEGVSALSGHFDIERLYAKLHHKAGKISLATIYRTLHHLVNSGLIREVMRCQDRPQYEKIFGCAHHDHLICVKCGKVIEFKDDAIESLQKRVCKEFRFQPTEHRLGIRGYCRDCR